MAEAEARASETSKPSLSERIQSCSRNNFLMLAILTALAAGAITGILMKFMRDGGIYSKREVMYVEFLGALYIRALKLVTLPLVTTNMVASLTKLNLSFAGMLGMETFLYFLITTMLAAAWGIFLVVTIGPGKDAQDMEVTNGSYSGIHITMVDTIMDLIRAIFPSNYLEATIRTYRTYVKPPMIDVVDANGTVVLNPDGSVKQQQDKDIPVLDWEFDELTTNETNYISICIFTIVFGVAYLFAKKTTEIVKETFNALSEVVIFSVTVIVWSSPLGVFFLLCAKIIEEKHWMQVFIQVGWYSFTVVFGILTYGFIFLQLVYVVFVRKNPFVFTFNMIEAISTAFATASSLVTLPVTLKCVVQKNGIPPPIARFIVPVGSTMNMNGAAIYEAVGPIFISQVLNRKITIFEMVVTCIVATLASVGTAGIPQAGLVTMVMVLSELNLDPDTLTYIIAVDWLLDRFCTALNIFGDAVGAAVVFAMVTRSFKKLQAQGVQSHRIRGISVFHHH